MAAKPIRTKDDPRTNELGVTRRFFARTLVIFSAAFLASLSADAFAFDHGDGKAPANPRSALPGTAGSTSWARIPLGQAEFGVLSTNGRWSITTDNGDTVRVAAVSEGAPARTLKNPTDQYIHYARVSPSGDIAVGIAKRAAVVWDVPGNRVIRIVEAKPEADLTGFLVAVSSDASAIAAVKSDGTAQVFNTRSGALMGTHRGRAGSMFFSEDGTKVVTQIAQEDEAEGSSVEVWNARSGAIIARFDLDLGGVDGCSVCWGISPDGGRVAVADSEEGRLYLYDAARGRKAMEVRANITRMTALTYSPDSRMLLTADSQGIVLRDAATGRPVRVLKAPQSSIQHAAFSADSRWIATAGADHTVRIWNAESGRLLSTQRVQANGGGFRLVSLTPDGNAVMAVGDEQESYLWQKGQSGRTMVALQR